MTRAGLLLSALGLCILGLVVAGLGAQPAGAFGSLSLDDAHRYVGCALAAGAFYLAAVWLVRRRAMPGWALAWIIGIGIAARLIVVAAPPVLSTDLYRYVWDGRVQAAGINPYLYLPNDPALESLRDAGSGPTAIYGNINRVDSAHTIYPPAAQLLFAAIGLTAPSMWTVKLVMMGFDLLTMLAALLLLRAAERPAALLLIWAWNPLVIWEFAGAGHIDAAALAAVALAMLAATWCNRRWAGAMLGIAVLFKLLPAALFPALWRPRDGQRWDFRTPYTAGMVIILAYLVYISAGWQVFGYLPGYASEEGLDAGGGFLLIRLLHLVMPTPPVFGTLYLSAGLVLLLGLAAVIAFRRPWPATPPARAMVIGSGVLILSGTVLAVLSPHYPWYMTAVVLPAVLVPAWSVLWLTIAAPLLYLDHGHGEVLWPALVFLPALPLLAIDLYSRRRSRTAAPAAVGDT